MRCCAEGSKKAATGEEADKLVPRLACLERSIQAALRVLFSSRVKPNSELFSAPFEAVLHDLRGKRESPEGLSRAHDPAEADDTGGRLSGKRDRERQPHFDRRPGLQSSPHTKQHPGPADVFRLAFAPGLVPDDAVADGRLHLEARGALAKTVRYSHVGS